MHEAKYERVKLADLVPADYNPRAISDEALSGLTAVMQNFGLVQPIVWNRRTRNVVGGHQRLKVLQAQGVDEVTVAVVDLSPGRERALNVALNNPHITGEFTDHLQQLLREIQEDDAVLFSDAHLDRLLDKRPDETDWAKELGADSAGGEPAVMQRTFVLSMTQAEVLDEALQVATEKGLALDPDNSNRNGNALHAVCAGFLAWARQQG